MRSRTLSQRAKPRPARTARSARLDASREQLGARVRVGASSRTSAARASAETSGDSAAGFVELRRVLARFAPRLVVVSDAPDLYHLNSAAPGPDGKPLFFAAVRQGRTYVSFHLMPVYTHPELLDGLDPELRRRLHGKSCFNFKSVDAKTARGLIALIERGFGIWKQAGWV